MSNLVQFKDTLQLNLYDNIESKSSSYLNQDSPQSEQSPSYSPLESPVEFPDKSFFEIGYLETFVECMLCVQDMIETISCVYDMTGHVNETIEKEYMLKRKLFNENDLKRRLKSYEETGSAIKHVNNKKLEKKTLFENENLVGGYKVTEKLDEKSELKKSRQSNDEIEFADIQTIDSTQQKKKKAAEKAKRCFYMDINDDLGLFLKMKKKESIVTLQKSINISFKKENDTSLEEKFDNYFVKNKFFFLNLIKTFLNSLQLVKIENREDFTSDTAKSYLNSYLLNQMTKKTNDTDISYLIMINLCFMILDLLYNCSFNTVLWFMDQVSDKYKNLIKGIIIYIIFRSKFIWLTSF